MPLAKRKTVPLSAAMIERVHDSGIDMVWPGIEPVEPNSCLHLNLLYSAASQPYQECFGQELYPSVYAKAAYIFCHLATSHIFSNGNKRTAILCLDTFLLANSNYLNMDNEEMYVLAQDAAMSGEREERFASLHQRATHIVQENSIPLDKLREMDLRLYRASLRARRSIRTAPFNQLDHPLNQR